MNTYSDNFLPETKLVSNTYSENSFPLITADKKAIIFYDQNDYEGVIRAITDLQSDIEKVTSLKPGIYASGKYSAMPVIIGTAGRSKDVDRLIETGKINSDDLKNKWESFVITVLDNPFDKVDKALVIAGSDKRGTIYGIYELSKQLGVSPWYWWADVPVKKQKEVYVNNVYFSSGEPKVRYRGIFINDEIPCMGDWAKEKFGGMNSKMYSHIFELLLRLRANYLWPGMWGSFKEYNPMVPVLYDEDGTFAGHCFNEDDPLNPQIADMYGIIMGTSHHEPMQRSQQEWIRNKEKYGNGEWNYMSNKNGLKQFFTDGIVNSKDYECLITLGMRGDEDMPMVDAGSIEENFKLIENIISDQRKIIKNITGKPINQTPQVWTLYKEVLEYFDLGLNVPDDVIILLCDDDWGDVRRLPDLNSKKHPGGYGIYYHVGYYGAPRSSKWLSNSQISHLWEQLQLTYDYGVDKIWILNVGDIKPCEYPMDFFLKMAWNPEKFNETNLKDYSVDFCGEFYGQNNAYEASSILDSYCKFSSRCVAELLDDETYNLESGEFKSVRDEFMALEALALRQFINLEQEYKDSYKQIVLYPVQAMANLYDMYYSVAMNKKLYQEKDFKANYWAERVEECFKRDSLLSYDYNKNISEGKWNNMMNQVHIGYTQWHPPVKNIMPEVKRLTLNEKKEGGYIFTQSDDVVVIEAEHYYEKKDAENSFWKIIPDHGRTLSGISMFPYSQSVKGGELFYKMKINSESDSVIVRFIFDCTLPYKKDGHSLKTGFADAEEVVFSINDDLTWQNNYTKMYPAAASRIIEKEVKLPLPSTNTDNNVYTLKIKPVDSGIVLHKIIIDNGGYIETRLKMNESPYVREL